MSEDTTKSEAKPSDRYKLKFDKHGMVLEICTDDKRFGKHSYKTKYEYCELANVYNSLQNVSIHSIEPSMNEKGELDSLDFVILDGENYRTPDNSISENLCTDGATKTSSLTNSNIASNDENCTFNPNIIVTDRIPTTICKDVYMPPFDRFFRTIHYKRALLIMMGHSIEEIKNETGASNAMIQRGLGWYKAYGIIYAWDATTGDVIITSKGAAILQKEGLIDRWDENKVYSKCKN